MRRIDFQKTILWYRAKIVESLYNDVMDLFRMEVSGMYQIAIFDDEIAELDRVERILRGKHSPLAESAFLLECFTNIGDLLRRVETEHYQPDILLMDISMSGESGIETVRKLRVMGSCEQVIFFASTAEYALAAFGVAAVSYLLRPVSEKALFRALNRILEQMQHDRCRYVLFEVNCHVRRLALEDIIYCEAQGKKQCIYLSGGERLLLRMTMTRLRETLCIYKEFVGIGVSYIVNLGHVESWNRQTLMLDNRQEIYLPRGAYRGLSALGGGVEK